VIRGFFLSALLRRILWRRKIRRKTPRQPKITDGVAKNRPQAVNQTHNPKKMTYQTEIAKVKKQIAVLSSDKVRKSYLAQAQAHLAKLLAAQLLDKVAGPKSGKNSQLGESLAKADPLLAGLLEKIEELEGQGLIELASELRELVKKTTA
jgi:hypothetical protein